MTDGSVIVALSWEQVITAAGLTDPAGTADDLRTVCGLDPLTAQYRRTILDVGDLQAAGWGLGAPEDYLIDGDEDGYERTVELADAYAAGDDVPPVLFGHSPGQSGIQLIDGMHRLCGAVAAGLTQIEAFEALPA